MVWATGHVLQGFSQLLELLGMKGELGLFLAQISACVFLALLAWGANLFVKLRILRWVQEAATLSENKWDDFLLQYNVFERFSHLAPAVILHLAAPYVFPHSGSLQLSVRRFVLVYIITVTAWSLHSLVNATVAWLKSLESTRNKPLDSYAQLVKGCVWLFAAIFTISELLNRSPWALLGGLGAFTAILLLVFRDAILGFVASVQITTLDLVHKGDWVEIPKYGVNGNVIDFSLTTIKIQNWDKTISTVPSYTLISDTFKNWRGMTDAGARRIKRSIALDMHSVKFLDQELLERLRKIQLLHGYLIQKEEDILHWNEEAKVDASSIVNGRHLTNIGTFRAYIDAYLREHPQIAQTMTFLVRQLEPTPKGVSIEIYVFSKELRWAYYEGIIADIFDHILAVIPTFELRVFQEPSGGDIQQIAEAILGTSTSDTSESIEASSVGLSTEEDV